MNNKIGSPHILLRHCTLVMGVNSCVNDHSNNNVKNYLSFWVGLRGWFQYQIKWILNDYVYLLVVFYCWPVDVVHQLLQIHQSARSFFLDRPVSYHFLIHPLAKEIILGRCFSFFHSSQIFLILNQSDFFFFKKQTMALIIFHIKSRVYIYYGVQIYIYTHNG